MRPGVTLAVCLLLAGSTAAPEPPHRLAFEPYVVQGFDGALRQASLGRLSVPARRTEPGGGRIELAVIRLASTASAPAEPIVFLMGGPGIGASVMARVPVYAQLFERLRGVADVILLDQRGTGLTQPALECSERDRPLGPGAFESRAALLAEMRAELDACVAAWAAKGVHAGAYTSRENAGDVEDLRRALGAARVNLLAFSYGTEVALTLIREHGGGVARAVLAGVRGPDQALKLPSVYDLKLRQVARLAATSPAWSGTLVDGEDLVARLERVLAAARNTPLRVSVADRGTQRAVELRVGREGLQMLFTQSLDSARFPALVVSLERGDTRVLARLLEPLYHSLGRGGSNLMARAVNCAAGASPSRRARVEGESQWALLGMPFDDVIMSPDYCRGLGNQLDADPDSWRPFTSDVETLFVSGSLDSQTPPAQAEEVRYGFRNGVHLVVVNARHETLPLPAVQDAVVDFFKGGNLAGRVIVDEPAAFLGIEEAASRPCGPRGC